MFAPPGLGLKVPAGQNSHAASPSASRAPYLPAPHMEHDAADGAPGRTLDDPGGHSSQVPMSEAAMALLNVEGGHCKHGDAPVEAAAPVNAPTCDKKVPRAHARQPDAIRRTLVYVPGSHMLHTSWDEPPRARLTVPMGHGVHGSSCWLLGTRPVMLEYLPTGQSAHTAASDSLASTRNASKVPRGHCSHSRARTPALKVPARQGVHATLAPASRENDPRGHGMHVPRLAPATCRERVPAGHSVQAPMLTCPVRLLYRPAGHASHAASPPETEP